MQKRSAAEIWVYRPKHNWKRMNGWFDDGVVRNVFNFEYQMSRAEARQKIQDQAKAEAKPFRPRQCRGSNHEAKARTRRGIKTSRRGRGSILLPRGETSASRHISLIKIKSKACSLETLMWLQSLSTACDLFCLSPWWVSYVCNLLFSSSVVRRFRRWRCVTTSSTMTT